MPSETDWNWYKAAVAAIFRHKGWSRAGAAEISEHFSDYFQDRAAYSPHEAVKTEVSYWS